MKLRKRSYSFFALGWLVAGLLLPFTQVQAAPAPGGITVSPAQITTTLTQQIPARTLSLTLSNAYSVPIAMTATFQGIDENAGLLVPTDQLEPALAAALHISQTAFTIPAHSRLSLQLQINDSAALTPGGHYATLVLKQLPATTGRLNLNTELSLAIFVLKPDGAFQSLSLDTIQSNGWLLRVPSQVDLTFTNRGNIHDVPRAAVDVRGPGATLLAHGVANLQSLPLLPGYTLPTSAQLTSLEHAWWPGRLTVVVNYRADGSNQVQTLTRHQWYVPPFYPVVFLLLGWFAYWLYHQVRSPATARATSQSPDRKPTVTGLSRLSVIRAFTGAQLARLKHVALFLANKVKKIIEK